MDEIKPYVQLLLPGRCYETFLTDFNFFDEECLKTFISKCLGYALIVGAMLVKIPQILKIFSAKSGEGLSMPSLYLELVAITATCAYGIVSEFPFSVYGDSVFLLINTALIAVMVLLYSGQTNAGLAYMGIQGSLTWYLFSGLAPLQLVWGLQSSCVPVIVASKLTQAYENYRNGSTGQLSIITLSLLFLGSLAKIFTSHQETGDITLMVTYLTSTVCNGMILSQICYYWNADKKKKAV